MHKETKSTCPYCGTGCGVIIESTGDRITGVRGDPTHPANFGRLCTKGSTLHLTATQPVTLQTRLLTPLHRTQRGQAPAPIGWDAALDMTAGKFAGIIQAHGPDAVGFYVSGQLLTEDYYVFNKLAKGLIGTNNIDTNSRLCMSSAVAGYKATLGADAPPACYEDLALAQCLFITGSNTAWAHPILFRRIEDARAANPGLKIIVADPRRTETAAMADLHLPILPGTDVMLCHGMLHLMLWEGWVDAGYIAAHTTGFEALKATVRDCTPARVAEVCGITEAQLATAARWFALGGADAPVGSAGARAPTLSLYCQGLNQSSSGTDKNAALINLHLACGQIGRPGAGPFSLTGQPNAMGGREVGGLANLLSAHRDLANPAHRAEVAALWGVPQVPATPGRTAVEMFQAAADGEIRALWIACTNPAQSLPDQATVRRALERAEFVVVQEAFSTTATCAYADLLLPATTWGEKTGTVTNSERRISRVRPAVPAPGQARHDWAIAVEFARRLQDRLRPEGASLFPYDTGCAEAGAEAVWNEHRETTRGRDLDITGLSWALIDRQGPQHWPFPEGAAQGRARLYEDGVFPTPDGRARFAAAAWKPVAEPRSARYPFSLTTGRLRDQWHGMSRTGTLGRLFGHTPEPCVQLHPQDMERRRLAEGELVRVESRRGAVIVPVQASTDVGLSQAFIAMHWGGEMLCGHAGSQDGTADGTDAPPPALGVNAVTSPAFCPASKQPELKHAAVHIERAALPWRLYGMAWLPADEALAVRAQLAGLLAGFPFAVCVPFGNNAPLSEPTRERHGVLLRVAGTAPAPDALLARIEALLGLGGADTLRYADARRGQRRALRLEAAPAASGGPGVEHGTGGADGNELRLGALLLAGDTSAEAWLRDLLQQERPAQGYGRRLLSPGLQAPDSATPAPPRSRPVCSCMNVSDAAIAAQLGQCHGGDAERLGQLQAALGCGTQCGSCLPELRRMVRDSAAVPATESSI
ncbi:Nitrate reductase [Paracidovorax avenae ATCC 19860]|uniref:Nitrate reductase n=1 Tax=Paracidovorax avenae (strain ATCC 19860 / DSM 7227 / CCUG 15838 / JCM 20985 / LMG 2117 / NCPPB 1011) TaxID=643561 RepID=F0Q6K5_PARA1|nr:nitrate reductase [Paracidovorax avenae]ADX46951.1 Nitrate reductase [Paracidovorax avenae ATCC 19860]